MKLPLVPSHAFREYTDISPGFLKELGVRFLMLDLDNTIARYSEHLPTEAVLQWVGEMSDNNIELFFISNSKRKTRVDVFARVFGIGFMKDAHKPSPECLLRAMEQRNLDACESAFLGDQIFSDTLAANRAGVISIVVRPLSLKNPLLLLRYAAEAPFRAVCALRARKPTCGN